MCLLDSDTGCGIQYSFNNAIYIHLCSWKDFWVCWDPSQNFTQNNSKREHIHLTLHKAKSAGENNKCFRTLCSQENNFTFCSGIFESSPCGRRAPRAASQGPSRRRSLRVKASCPLQEVPLPLEPNQNQSPALLCPLRSPLLDSSLGDTNTHIFSIFQALFSLLLLIYFHF